MTEDQAFSRWIQKLHTEWLPNWRDMPETQFLWHNLLIVALEDAVDDRDLIV